MTDEEEGRRNIEDAHSMALDIAGLAEVLHDRSIETIAEGDLSKAQDLAWAYSSLSRLAKALADKLSAMAP